MIKSCYKGKCRNCFLENKSRHFNKKNESGYFEYLNKFENVIK